MANPVYRADAIRTPVANYLLVDRPTNFNGQNRTLVPLTPLDPICIDYILSFASSNPHRIVENFVHEQIGIHVASGDIGHLLNPETLERCTQLFYQRRVEIKNSPQNDASRNRDMKAAKNNYIFSVWESFLRQLGKNALPYDGEIAAASEVNGTIRIASSMGGEIRSPEPFEIMLFQVLGRERKNGEIYPVETLALELADKIKGEGAEDFFKKFQNIQ